MPSHLKPRTRGVRWNKADECFEMWCPGCEAQHGTQTFWPLDTDFWSVSDGLAICRACRAEFKRLDQKARSKTKRQEYAAKNKAYHTDNREVLLWKMKQRRLERLIHGSASTGTAQSAASAATAEDGSKTLARHTALSAHRNESPSAATD